MVQRNTERCILLQVRFQRSDAGEGVHGYPPFLFILPAGMRHALQAMSCARFLIQQVTDKHCGQCVSLRRSGAAP